MRVAIAGAGIGGLTLALSLHSLGIPCRVFEAADEIRPLGVGINVQPHAIKELDRLGLVPQLDRTGIRTAEVAYFSAHGNKIWSEPRGETAGYHWPQFSIHRGHLQMMLLDEARKRLGADGIRTGATVAGWTETDAGIQVHLDGGETIAGDLFIAADGIHSMVRSRFLVRSKRLRR